MKKEDIEAIRPEIFELIKLGNGVGGHNMSGLNREQIGLKIRQIFEESKRRTEK